LHCTLNLWRFTQINYFTYIIHVGIVGSFYVWMCTQWCNFISQDITCWWDLTIQKNYPPSQIGNRGAQTSQAWNHWATEIKATWLKMQGPIPTKTSTDNQITNLAPIVGLYVHKHHRKTDHVFVTHNPHSIGVKAKPLSYKVCTFYFQHPMHLLCTSVLEQTSLVKSCLKRPKKKKSTHGGPHSGLRPRAPTSWY
jgi:hypothetical protein